MEMMMMRRRRRKRDDQDEFKDDADKLSRAKVLPARARVTIFWQREEAQTERAHNLVPSVCATNIIIFARVFISLILHSLYLPLNTYHACLVFDLV